MSINTRFLKPSPAILIFLAPLSVLPLWGQHAAHSHGKAELNLIQNTDYELIAELIAPAESVYGFEHRPRNQRETQQMEEGLTQLKNSLFVLVSFDKTATCKATDIEDLSDANKNSGASKHASHDHDHNHKKHHSKPGGSSSESNDHHHKSDHSNHRNVMIRWKIQCQQELTGQTIRINWDGVLKGIHRINLTLLTSDRQDAVSLSRSGAKVRL